MLSYPAIYKNNVGSFETTIKSSGNCLCFEIMGEIFIGRNFTFLERKNKNYLSHEKHEFDEFGGLINFEIFITFQVHIEKNGCVKKYPLEVKVINENGEVYLKDIKFYVGLKTLTTKFTSDFETILIKLHKLLPEGMKIISCLSCKHSEYSRSGNHIFGDLGCSVFKNLEIADNEEMDYSLKSSCDKSLVQETFLCERYMEIQIGDDLYKDWETYVLKRN